MPHCSRVPTRSCKWMSGPAGSAQTTLTQLVTGRKRQIVALLVRPKPALRKTHPSSAGRSVSFLDKTSSWISLGNRPWLLYNRPRQTVSQASPPPSVVRPITKDVKPNRLGKYPPTRTPESEHNICLPKPIGQKFCAVIRCGGECSRKQNWRADGVRYVKAPVGCLRLIKECDDHLVDEEDGAS
jgi:hypothetical protein